MGARLGFFIKAWEKVTADPWVLRTIREGYRLEFTSPPPTGGLSTHPDPTRGTKGCVAPRGAPEPIGKEGDRPPAWAGERSNNVILLLGAQEGQQMAANHKSKTSESAYQAEEVPYGNSQINPAPTVPRAVGHGSGPRQWILRTRTSMYPYIHWTDVSCPSNWKAKLFNSGLCPLVCPRRHGSLPGSQGSWRPFCRAEASRSSCIWTTGS